MVQQLTRGRGSLAKLPAVLEKLGVRKPLVVCSRSLRPTLAEALGEHPHAVFSGFHLTNPGLGVDEPKALIRAVGEELRRRPTHYYTGHCTGQGPYAILKEMLGDQITYMAGGTEFTL